MDHAHYRYRPRGAPVTRSGIDADARTAGVGHDARSLQGRRLGGPDATGVRAFALLVLEHWEAEPAPGTRRDPRFVGEFGSFSPDYRSWTQREYGLRIGVFRVVDALTAAGIVPAVAADAQVLQRLPALVAPLDRLGVEWVAHGLGATRMMHGGMPLDEQRALIRAGVDAVQSATGRKPLGWLSQDWGTTPDTFQLLADAGLRYTLDWCNDDAPFALLTTPPLTALPLSAEWDDVQAQWLRQLSPRAHADLARGALQRLCEERTKGDDGLLAPVFGLALHPWLSGMSSRIGVMRSLLCDLARTPGVHWTLPAHIAQTARATVA
jgi:peptidoglycan/xylan/chitin deacetylase (PgdA/CDA1 family)